MTEFFITGQDGFQISTALFDLEHPKGLVQIIHGSVEHKERYYSFSRYLNEKGYAVILSDNRGHGASVSEKYTLGYMDGFQLIVDDLYEVSNYVMLLHPMKPLYLFGHSLGSVFARCYIEKHDDLIDKLILSGTVHSNLFLSLGILLTRFAILTDGPRGSNAFLRYFIMNGSKISWISTDQANISAYKADPLCGFKYCNQSVLTVMESVKELKAYNHYLCNNPDLPVLCISGENDPVAGGIRGTTESLNILRKVGYHNFQNIIYPGMKHEILNEKKHLEVYEDIIRFMKD